ncbi:mucin-4 [Panthera onca]
MPLSTSSTDDTSASSHASNSHAVTSEVSITPASTDTTVGYTKHTTHPEIGSFTPVTSTLSRTNGVDGHTTASSSITSTAEMTAFSHDYRSQSMETSRESQTDATSVFITSTPSSSLNGHTLTEIVSQEISTSRKASTLSSSSVSIAPLTTSVLLTVPTSTDTTVGNGKDTSTPITRTVIPVPSTVPMKSGLEVQSIAIFSSTSTPGTSASTQNYQTPSIETTRESEFSEITSATTSALLSLPSRHNLSGRIPPVISPSGEAITSPTSSDSKTPLTTSETLTASTSIDTTVENTGDTSLPVTSSFPPFIPSVSTTWQSAIQPTPLSISTPAPKTSTVFHTHPDTETAGWPHSNSSMSFIPDKTTFTSSSFSDSSHTTQSQKELFSTPMVSTILVTESSSSSIASSISGVTSTVSTVDEEVPTPHSYLSTSPQETTVAISKTHWTQGIGTTGDIHVSRSSNVTQTVKTVTSASPSSLLSEHTSQQTITSSPARQSTPLSSSTSSQESSVVSQIGHTQGPRTTQESQTTSLIFPMTDTIKTVTSATSPFKSSGHLPSENVPQDTPTTGEVTTFTPAPSRDSHTTQVSTTTTELWTSPTSADTSPGTLRGTSLSIKSTTFHSSVVSTTLGPRGQSTSPASSASPDTSAISQTHQTQSTVTTGEPHTNTPASLVTDTTFLADTILVGTATASSSTASSQTTLGSAFPGISTSDKIKGFSPTFSRENHITQSKTELLSSAASHDTTPGTMELVSIIVPNTSQEISAVSQKAQTQIIGSTRGSEAISSVSQVTDTFSTVTPPPPSSTPNVSMLPKTTAHTLSSSDTSTTLISNPSPLPTLHSTTLFTGHSAPLSVTSTFPPSTASSSSIVKTQTPGTITTSLRTGSQRSTTSLPPTTSQTLTTSTPSTSTSKQSTAVPVPIKPKKGVSLFPYGPSVGDQEFVRRTVDFTSPLFKPQIGFPLGSSLRDYLYFTDNGQIIFPESEYQIFSYPNPPLRGFTGWDPVALVAPFWDDADFSGSHGTIFYQEYETLYNEHNLLVWQVESWIKKFAHIRNYKARWTLKVTWVSAPAYPAQWTFGTNTYQAILSTDGSRSYALFLYQSGGMQWDVTQRPGNPVLMGFSSGDGYFENSPLTFQPVWEKYHPDQFLNSNSGLQGLQVYRLHRGERPNYRLRCLQWLNRQPQWPQWGWNQVSCPCSWQQGLWDLRFQPISIGWWGLGSRQLCRVSSWRGGVCCSYGPWGELLQGWTVSTPWQFDQELEPWDWCCRGTDKPSFCALYQQRRPRIGCAGYRPPRPAWMFGDPHITTLDGANYTFNGLGDFLLVRAWDRNSSFLLQGRTAQTSSAQATNFIAFAAKYNTSSLNPITVRWLLKPNDTIHVQVNNQTVTFETNHEDPEGQEIFNTTGIVMTRNGSLVSASFDGTVTISVTALSNILHASCSLPEEYRNSTEGLLGVWNDNPDDDFRMPNGSTILNKSDEWQLYQFGMTWKINDTRLLGKRDNPLPSNFTPVFLFQLKNNSSGENLVSECNGDEQCIYDSLATGNTSTGLNTKMLFSRYQLMNATLSKYPPSIEGEHVVEAYLGQTKLTQYTSGSENVIFTLRNSNTDFKLFENGTLLWTPKLLEPFTLEILARNAKVNLSSVLQPKTVVCACREESQCLYNQTSWVGNSSLEVAGCKCDGNSFGPYCKRSRDPCEEPCFPNVKCIPGEGCEACPQNLTGDGRHCAALENSPLCQNVSCPVNYCYNQGHCYISQTPDCHPTCTCPPAFTDTRCFVAGNNFTPTIHQDLPVRIIQLSLREGENATMTDVNASVAYRLGKLDVRAFLQNSQVVPINSGATQASGRNLQRWSVISEFQYLPRGPVIDFLNTKLLDAVVEAFLPQASWRRWNRSEGPRTNVNFHSISREDVYSVKALNVSMLKTYFKCNGYKGYHLVYSPHSGLTCVSPCSEGYCEHGGQCQHLPQGPRCSCVPFSIYTPWGERCEHLSMKLGAFFGILFGALGALLLLGAVVFVVLRFWCYPRNQYSYPLDTES